MGRGLDMATDRREGGEARRPRWGQLLVAAVRAECCSDVVL